MDISMEKLTTSQVKVINKNRIYRLIYESGEISRQEIVQQLSLSLPTVNQNLKELQEEMLIRYTGSFQSTGGRKAQVIVPITDAKVAVGIDIRKHNIKVLLIDLRGKILDYEKYSKSFEATVEYGKYLNYLAENIIKHNGISEAKVLGVGIAIPGIFSQGAEEIVKAPSLGVQGFSLSCFYKAMKYPCMIDNDANSGAFTELWNNISKENGKFDSSMEVQSTNRNMAQKSVENHRVYISVEKGIGGCIITKDGLYRGLHHRAGEFGHMTIVPGGKPCNCGKRGCLEAYVSVSRLSDDLNCQIEDFFVELENGNTEYADIWEEYLKFLCLGINNIYMMYDSEIILGGLLTQYLQPYMEDIKKRLVAYNAFEETGEYFKLTKYQSKATAVGVALQHVSKFIGEI